MVVEQAYLRIAGGRESDFEEAFRAARPLLAQARGCTSVELFRDAENPSTYLLRVGWERLEDHLVGFPASDAGKQFAEQVAGFFAGAPEVRHFESTDRSAA
ncbi:antibiotic biosynthesis monooxygenase [Amycolatopsis rhabdoformis]|uniref:Antibiotic biosynthesis monooxygenase n=1 Tax=Amycolatopsis rhabdoformis TaxID=1448059 RepID=A0ABZ1I7L9_9PSEU|nr:antibiotic biosynthesis monooxygenase [Amycolatopsis rhabdoformis]WSE29976.1 antibiotic biosynthesis monooxygenase [Amycolatopsis rhabdoformis]